VNDWDTKCDETTFRKRFVSLVDQMLGFSGKDRLPSSPIPDFSVNPTGARYSRGRNISEGLLASNEIINDEQEAQSESCRCILDQQSNENDPH